MLGAFALPPTVSPTSSSCLFGPLSRALAVSLLGILVAAGASAQAAEPSAPAPLDYPDPADDAAQIKRLRATASSLRDAAERRLRAASAACQGRFFVNACLDDARAERLRVLAQVRAQEAEAAAIERRLRLAEQAADERRREAAADAKAERQAAQAAAFHEAQAAEQAAQEARRLAREQRLKSAGRTGGQ